MKRATEKEWLEFFFRTADFGPAHEDVLFIIAERFMEETGLAMPKGYLHCIGEEE